MSEHRRRVRIWLGSVVAVHLVVSMVHGMAHAGGRIPLSPAANLFVFGVIFAGPVIGLALLWPAERAGVRLIAATMAASLVFGVVNHFVLSSPDHVGHVDPEWRPLFASTAILLAVLEAAAAGLAIYFARVIYFRGSVRL